MSIQLIEAVKLGDLAAVEESVKADVDVNQQDEHGWTPLNWAAGKGDTALVKLLLDRGGDVLKVGRDLRTPYDIALAAGHVEVVKLLKDAEQKANGGIVSRPERQFCKAYSLSQLRQFPGWTENKIPAKEAAPKSDDELADDGNGASPDDTVFLHHDFTVTKSMWHNEDVVFDLITPEWEEFCREQLKFKVPDDLDYIVAAHGTEN